MSGFKFSPPSLANLPVQPLDTPTLSEIVAAEVDFDGNPTLGQIAFSFDASARGSIIVCNSEVSEDEEDGVLGAADAEEKEDALSPALTFDPEHAWLKYRFEGSAKGSATAEFTPGGVAIQPRVEAQKGVVFAYYRQHGVAEIAAEAVLADAVSLRAAFNPDDVLALGEGDALLYRLYGELNVGLTLKWSDVFTASLNNLRALLPSAGVFALKAEAGAEVNFRVGVRDDFRLVFTKGGPVGDIKETVRVSVFKSKTREVGLDVSLGVTVEFADPDAVEGQLSKVYEALAGPAFKDLDRILEEADRVTSLEALPAELQMPARFLMIRLGLSPQIDKLTELRLKWEEIKGKVPGIIEKVAQTKVALSFTYEYLRVSTDRTLLRADLDAETFRRFHPDLMVCRLEGLTGWLRDEAPEGTLKRYLRQKSVKVSKAWGFSLGISPWGVKLGGTDRLETTRVIQENVEGAQRVAYDGMRSYEGVWMDDKVTFAADFKADMSEFKAPPQTCHFNYGLSLKWEWEEKKLKAEEFEAILDHAQVWHLFLPDGAADAVKAVEERFGEGANVRLELTLDDETLKELLPRLAAPPPPASNVPPDYATLLPDKKLDVWGAEALAAAMPYTKMFEARRDNVKRQKLYAPLWRFYFREDSRPFGEYRESAFQNIPSLSKNLNLKLPDADILARHERDQNRRQFSFGGMIELHQGAGSSARGIHDNWKKFAQGLLMLAEAARPGNCEPYENIEKSFNNMASFFTQSLYLRALGYFFAEVAQRSNLADRIQRTLTVTYGDGEAVTLG